MSKRRCKPVKTALRPRTGTVWMWSIVVVITVSVTLAVAAMRSRPSDTAAPTSGQFLPTVENKSLPSGPAPDGMVWIPGGEFSMGAKDPHDMHDAVGMQATTD